MSVPSRSVARTGIINFRDRLGSLALNLYYSHIASGSTLTPPRSIHWQVQGRESAMRKHEIIDIRH